MNETLKTVDARLFSKDRHGNDWAMVYVNCRPEWFVRVKEEWVNKTILCHFLEIDQDYISQVLEHEFLCAQESGIEWTPIMYLKRSHNDKPNLRATQWDLPAEVRK